MIVSLVIGHVLDRTTGQGLAHVRLSAPGATATTDAAGAFALRGVERGTIAVTLESDDVPAQRFTVRVNGATTRHDFRACSTTLDYDCSGPAVPDSQGGGAS